MGGKLLSSVWNLPEKRLSNDEYLSFQRNVINNLYTVIPHEWKLGCAPAIRSKESHGDLDVICGYTSFKDRQIYDLELDLFNLFNVRIHRNSNVWSFPVDGFQVDVTFVPMVEFQSTIDYCSWGDASNLVGRIAHKFGLHHGHIGLSFWIRQSFFDFDLGFMDSDHVMQKVVLTRDFSEILPLLGFDYEQWKNGFDTNEEVYDWVARSKYFSPEIFAFENLNHINRVRNKKRAMYAGFVQWLELNSWKYNNHVFQNREYYISDWAEMFPSLKIAIKDNKQKFEMDRAFKHKLNGYRVMELLGISNGKEVGRVMSELHKLHTREDYVNMPQEKIDNLILGFKYYE
jgi:hypothetical protein